MHRGIHRRDECRVLCNQGQSFEAECLFGQREREREREGERARLFPSVVSPKRRKDRRPLEIPVQLQTGERDRWPLSIGSYLGPYSRDENDSRSPSA